MEKTGPFVLTVAGLANLKQFIAEFHAVNCVFVEYIWKEKPEGIVNQASTRSARNVGSFVQVFSALLTKIFLPPTP
jgi:hypothetical protein